MSNRNWNTIGEITVRVHAEVWNNGRIHFRRSSETYFDLNKAVAHHSKLFVGIFNPSYYNTTKIRNNTFISGLDYYNFFDELDLEIPVWKILETFRNLPEPLVRYGRYPRIKKFKFRDGPVPWTGGYGHGSSRGPEMVRELRDNSFLKYDEDLRDYHFKVRELPNDRW